MKSISVITPCFNEEDNVEELVQAGARQIPKRWAGIATNIFSSTTLPRIGRSRCLSAWRRPTGT